VFYKAVDDLLVVEAGSHEDIEVMGQLSEFGLHEHVLGLLLLQLQVERILHSEYLILVELSLLHQQILHFLVQIAHPP
jgi:hypothetical protein